MENKRTFKSVLFLIGLLVLCIVVFFGYYYFTGKKNPISNIFNNENKVAYVDNINGIYVYYEQLPQEYIINNSCSVGAINWEIVIMGDKFKLYKSSCLGTYPVESGKTEDLEIKEDSENKLLYFDYKGNTYFKKHEITTVLVGNSFKDKTKINPRSLKFLISETEFEGNYYDINDAPLDGATSYMLSLKVNNGMFVVLIKPSGNSKNILYESLPVSNPEDLPDIYAYGKVVVLINPDRYGSRYRYTMEVINQETSIYNFENQFPIEVNGYTIDLNSNIFISYQQSDRSFKMLVSPNDKFCEENSDSDEIAYYLFTMKYNYQTVNFDPPEFEKIGYKKEGCSYVNSLLGE